MIGSVIFYLIIFDRGNVIGTQTDECVSYYLRVAHSLSHDSLHQRPVRATSGGSYCQATTTASFQSSSDLLSKCPEIHSIHMPGMCLVHITPESYDGTTRDYGEYTHTYIQNLTIFFSFFLKLANSQQVRKSSSARIPRDKRVVVVGGGYGGTRLCRQLQKAGATFTLIDPKSYLYHNVASVRAVVDTSTSEKTFSFRYCNRVTKVAF